MDPAPFSHQSVLAAEVLEAFSGLPPAPGGGAPRLIDCTLGGGGHSALLLEAHPTLEVIGLDQDPAAPAAAAERLAPWGDRRWAGAVVGQILRRCRLSRAGRAGAQGTAPAIAS